MWYHEKKQKLRKISFYTLKIQKFENHIIHLIWCGLIVDVHNDQFDRISPTLISLGLPTIIEKSRPYLGFRV
jgi:hypothetical protein